MARKRIKANSNKRGPYKQNIVSFTKEQFDKLIETKPDKQRVYICADMKVTKKYRFLSALHSPGPKKHKYSTISFRVQYRLKSSPDTNRSIAIGRYGDTQARYVDREGVERFLDCSDLDAVKLRALTIINDADVYDVDPKTIESVIEAQKKETVEKLLGEQKNEYLSYKRHVEEIRTIEHTEDLWKRYWPAEWDDINVNDIKTLDITKHLAKISKGQIVCKFRYKDGRIREKLVGTPATARAFATQLIAFFKWYQTNNLKDAYIIPFTRDNAKKLPFWKTGAREGERHLTDDEIIAFWKTCDEFGVYGAHLKLALLTAQRFLKVGEMRRSAIVDSVWLAKSRSKNHNEADPVNKLVADVPLSDFAMSIINSVPVMHAGRYSKDYVLSINGKTPLANPNSYKRKFDQRMSEILGYSVEKESEHAWQHRDLRRTARTLMARLGVPYEVCEKCLAHELSKIARTYNRYDYGKEMKEAFQKLSDHVEKLVMPKTTDKPKRRVRASKRV